MGERSESSEGAPARGAGADGTIPGGDVDTMTVQGAPVTALLFGLMITRNVQDAVLRPPVEGQSIDLVWDARLDSVSERFGQLKRRAEGTVSTRPPAAAPVMV